MSGCHLWLGCTDRHGYGYFRLWPANLSALAHRFAYVLAHGQIPARLDVDQTCANRGCVNPHHLEAVSHTENIRRRDVRRRALGLPDMWAAARAAQRLNAVRA